MSYEHFSMVGLCAKIILIPRLELRGQIFLHDQYTMAPVGEHEGERWAVSI